MGSAGGSRRLHGNRAIGMQRFGRPQAWGRPFRQQASGPGACGHRVAGARVQLVRHVRGAGAVRGSDRHSDRGCGCGSFDDADADPRGQAGAVADPSGQAGAQPVTRPGSGAVADPRGQVRPGSGAVQDRWQLAGVLRAGLVPRERTRSARGRS